MDKYHSYNFYVSFKHTVYIYANNYKFVYFSQQLYQKFTDYDIRFYLYELLKVSVQKNLYHFQFT